MGITNLFAFARAVNNGRVNEFDTASKSAKADLLAQGWTPAQVALFIAENYAGATHDGRALWSTPDAAAQAIGFDGVAECRQLVSFPGSEWNVWGGDLSVPGATVIREEYTCWSEDEDGQRWYGGVGGSVRAWFNRESGQIVGYL